MVRRRRPIDDDRAKRLEAKLRAAVSALEGWEYELAQAIREHGAPAVAELLDVSHTTAKTWAGEGRGQPVGVKLEAALAHLRARPRR